MIKVVNVISDTNIGGAGKCVINFSQHYDTKQFEVSVVLPKGSALIEELQKTPVKIIEIDGLKDKSWDWGSLIPLMKILKQENPDIVHTHASSTARLAARLLRTPKIIYTRHCAYPVSDKIKKGLGHYLYKYSNELLADKIIAVGNAAEENLLEGGINPDMITTFFNGVEKVKELSEEDKKKLRQQYHLHDDEKVIGIVARLEKVKGHEIFLEAAKILLEEKKLKAKFFILGTGSEEEHLKQKATELGISNQVIFTGFVKNVGDYLNFFDVQVNCSFGTETSSLSLLEGMSIGVPAVASNYGGNPYLIKDGENGYVVPIKSARDTAEAIMRILSYPEIQNHMHQKSMEMYEANYTVEQYTKNIERVYQEMEAEPRVKKINLLDAIIVFIVIIACVFGYRYMNKVQNVITPGVTTKVVYQIRTNESISGVYDMIQEGTVLYDSVKNLPMGTIIKKEKVPSERTEMNLQTGEYEKSELPQEYFEDIILTVEAEANYSEKDISIGDYIVKVGKDVYIKGKGYASGGYIIAIER